MANGLARLACMVLPALVGVVATAQEPEAAPARDGIVQDFGTDRFAAGGSLDIESAVPGDLVAAAGRIEIEADVAGDAVALAGDVRVRAPVRQSLYVAAGRVEVDGEVGGDARLAGGNVDIARDARIAGNATVAGGSVRIDGAIDGALSVGGGRVVLDGPIAGDVEVGAGRLELGPNARIGGRLRYASRATLDRDPGAIVAGGIEARNLRRSLTMPEPVARDVDRAGGWFWTLGVAMLAALAAAFAPGWGTRLGASLRDRWGVSLVLGFLVLVSVPVAAVLLLITLVGIPLALVLILAYALLLLVGYVAAGVGTGHFLLRRLVPESSGRTAWRVLAAALAMLAIGLVARVPWIGGWVAFLALIAGLGLVVLQWPRVADAARGQGAAAT
jgi:cytoskeletal protein CcmA (bactofilin family)